MKIIENIKKIKEGREDENKKLESKLMKKIPLQSVELVKEK